MLKTAYRNNMKYKIEKYSQLLFEANQEVQKHVDIMNITIPELKRLANVKGDDDNWVIFESVNAQYKEEDEGSRIRNKSRSSKRKMSGSMSVEEVRSQDAIRNIRDDLVKNLKRLTNFYVIAAPCHKESRRYCRKLHKGPKHISKEADELHAFVEVLERERPVWQKKSEVYLPRLVCLSLVM